MRTVKIEVTEDQAHLIQPALDMYSRIGIGQFDVIAEHPTFTKILTKAATPIKEIEIADSTPQGKVLEIKNGRALIDGSVGKDGCWVKEQEWKNIEDVKLSVNWSKYHDTMDYAKNVLHSARNILINDYQLSNSGYIGINNKKVDDSCRQAFDILQVIRHEFWKQRGEKSFATVGSSVHFTSNSGDSDKIKVEIV